MRTNSQEIDSVLAKSLRERSDRELLSILENPVDWRPEVIDFARSELGRRSISTAQIDQKLSNEAHQRAIELQERSRLPLTSWESFWTILYGAGLGLLGLFAVWPQASRFKLNGYILKSKRSWRLYWFAFGARILGVILLIVYAALTSHPR